VAEGSQDNVADWHPDGHILAVTSDASGVNLPAGLAFGASFTPDETHLVTLFTTPTTRAELVLYNLDTDHYQTLLPADYGSIDPTLFVTSEHIWYPSYDGRQIPALLYKPQNLADGARWPAIVLVHGGPTAQWFRILPALTNG
jgi:dipeptidyl aminopeptidase/acylaminoacyl peptidase